ncbi:glycosyltransferase family 2 protein [Psychrobacillus sp. L4]|uniref:glycosyltransferase family 2 protein n=1 Tax=Psychrobacillus sp. L4 TaxID=3236892 RepID=UPI0036F2E4FC
MINLSIIIPHFNSVSSLKKLLESIPNSKDIQIIVVDDNSEGSHREEYLKLKTKYNQSNIEFYNNESKKKGAGACRNIGLNQANGKWLLFADADDYFTDVFFDISKRYFNSDNDVVFFKPVSINLDTGKPADRHLAYDKLIDNMLCECLYSEVFLRYRFYVPWSKLIKSSLVKENKIFFDEVIAANDLMFSAKVGYHMRNFDVSEENIYCVTRNKGSLTATVSHDVYNSRLYVYIDYFNFLKRYLNSDDFKALNLSGMGFLISSLLKFGVKKMFFVYRKLKKNNVRIISPKAFNPVWFMKKTLNVLNKNKKMKSYVIRE